MRWLNEPARWSEEDDGLTICTDRGGDFWRQTHYGFIHANGHALLHQARGDFTASVAFDGDYVELYDQAGLLLYADERNWLKCGVEYTSGVLNVSSVLTRDYSDWAVVRLTDRPSGPIHIRITRLSDTVMVDYSLDGARFDMIRLGYLPCGESVEVGPMACSPTGQGFTARFDRFRIGPPARHDDQ
jgi:regulation of enolase protein 1 (concanavalin A-like superfamily)